MSAQRGKDMLLKISDGQGGYETVAGLRASSLAFNARTVDTTNADSADEWQELLAGAGVRSASISGSGIFRDQASDERVRGVFFDDRIETWQIILPDFGTLEGAFHVNQLTYRGDHDGELLFEMALESAGAINFTAA